MAMWKTGLDDFPKIINENSEFQAQEKKIYKLDLSNNQITNLGVRNFFDL